MYNRKLVFSFFFSFLFGINKTIYRKELDVKILLFRSALRVWVDVRGCVCRC